MIYVLIKFKNTVKRLLMTQKHTFLNLDVDTKNIYQN